MYFTPQAWSLFEIKFKQKKEANEWFCRICSENLGQYEPSIVCECFFFWFHLKCVGLTLNTVPEKKTWFCNLCYK